MVSDSSQLTDRDYARYAHTVRTCYISYCSQSIVNNFAPLLFLTFERTLGINLELLAVLITVLFGTQLVIDVVAANYAEKIGYRPSILFGTILCTIGLAGLGVFPFIFPSAMVGLSLATVLYALGGGLIEVLVSPIIQGTPTKQPDQAMSGLHTSYSFGQVGVIVISTAFFALFGMDKWPILCFIWALVPLASAFMYMFVPLPTHVAEEVPEDPEEAGILAVKFYKRPAFFIFLAVLMGAGATEMSMGQWASAFTEQALGLSKSVGDLAGPAMFALMMGLSRLFYTKFGHRISLRRFVLFSATLCCIVFFVIGFVQIPAIALLAFAVGGFAIGIIQPGVFSLAAGDMPHGGMAMFGLFSMINDLGNAMGPAILGMVAGALGNNLHYGFAICSFFPLLIFTMFFAQTFVRHYPEKRIVRKIRSWRDEIYPD